MANRYWVGGTGTWNTTSTTNWSDTSGGSSGFSDPTSSDSVFFDQAGTYTVTMTSALNCLDITVSAGTVTFATGTSPTISIYGSMSLISGTVWSSTGLITFRATSSGKTITTNGTILGANVVFNGAGGGWTLGSALNLNTRSLTVGQGVFDTSSTGNYAVTCGLFLSSSSNFRTLELNSSTITFGVGNAGAIFTISDTNITFNASSSTFTTASSNVIAACGGLTYGAFRFTGGAATTHTITGANTFDTLSFAGRTTIGITTVIFDTDQTISTLTLTGGTASAYRTFLRSNAIGTTCTLAVTTLTAGARDYDFRDITITGAAAPLTGTRFGDAKGNSGITFPAAKTVFYRQTGSSTWGATGSGSWSATSGGALDAKQFPLAQDTAIFPATYPASGSTTTMNANYNIGTIDISLRTANTMTLAIGTTLPSVYGNWINGTASNNATGTGTITFAGRTSQTITSVTKTFAASFIINTPGGSVTLQDDFATSGTAFTHTAGTFDVNGNSFAMTSASGAFNSNSSNTRTIAIGSGTMSINGSGTCWNCSSSNLTVTGTGTISLYGASSKNFAGGNVQTYPILQQGGAGTLTVLGNNKFADLVTNDVGAIRFTSGTTNEFTAFTLTGSLGNVVTLGATTTAQATLKKSSPWYMGANSTDAGNNTGLTFTAGGGIDYLSVSYINGVVVGGTLNTSNFFAFF